MLATSLYTTALHTQKNPPITYTAHPIFAVRCKPQTIDREGLMPPRPGEDITTQKRDTRPLPKKVATPEQVTITVTSLSASSWPEALKVMAGMKKRYSCPIVIEVPTTLVASFLGAEQTNALKGVWPHRDDYFTYTPHKKTLRPIST